MEKSIAQCVSPFLQDQAYLALIVENFCMLCLRLRPHDFGCFDDKFDCPCGGKMKMPWDCHDMHICDHCGFVLRFCCSFPLVLAKWQEMDSGVWHLEKDSVGDDNVVFHWFCVFCKSTSERTRGEEMHGPANQNCDCCDGSGIAYMEDGQYAHCMECFESFFPRCPPGCTIAEEAKTW